MTESEKIDQIAAALAEAQKKFTTPAMSENVLGDPYASVDDILQATALPLAENGLKLYQTTDVINDQYFLITKLIHSSGQFISSKTRLILGATDKEIGAHIEFHRRHQMMLLLGVGAKDLDDNGTRQHESALIKNMKSVYEKSPKRKTWQTITKEQYDDVLETLQDYPEIAQEIMEKYGITTLADMPKEKFPADIKHIRSLIGQFHGR